MVINFLLECVVATANDMKSTFYKSKWTSWHCPVKKTRPSMCCDRKAERQARKFYESKASCLDDNCLEAFTNRSYRR